MMIPFPICAVLATALALWPAVARAESVPAHAEPAAHTEQAAHADTSNGVAAVKPTSSEASAKPAPSEAAAKPEPAPLTVNPAPSPTAATAPKTAATPSEAQRYCQNIAAAAAEARYVWQTRRLTELQGKVTEKITALEARAQELTTLLARRDEALKRADAALISIYAKMRPETAAAQISVLDDEIAAAVLQKLTPRAASAILNEISPERAARLVNTITGATPPAAPEEKKS